jgi:hypothetical protein
MRKFSDGYFDIIYIDGDHSYNGVQSDLSISIEKIKPNGTICGHDYTTTFPGVIQAVNEFCTKFDFEIEYLTQDGCPSYFLKRKIS